MRDPEFEERLNFIYESFGNQLIPFLNEGVYSNLYRDMIMIYVDAIPVTEDNEKMLDSFMEWCLDNGFTNSYGYEEYQEAIYRAQGDIMSNRYATLYIFVGYNEKDLSTIEAGVGGNETSINVMAGNEVEDTKLSLEYAINTIKDGLIFHKLVYG